MAYGCGGSSGGGLSWPGELLKEWAMRDSVVVAVAKRYERASTQGRATGNGGCSVAWRVVVTAR